MKLNYLYLLIPLFLSTNAYSQITKTYTNNEVGFSFEYPSSQIFLEADKYPMDQTKSYVKVFIRPIGVFDSPGDIPKEDQMKNIEALTSGKFGVSEGFEPSQKVKSVGFLFAQEYMELRRFDVCDVTLQRSLRFYFNNKQITITLFGPVEVLLKEMDEFFIKNSEHCPNSLMWDEKHMTDFYKTLAKDKGSKTIQKWYESIDVVAESVTFKHR